MNKTLTISGQTIELPFTEEEYQRILIEFSKQSHDPLFWRAMFNTCEKAYGRTEDLTMFQSTALAIGLHLAEKEKQGEIDKLNKIIEAQENVLKLLNQRLDEIAGYGD